MVTWAGGTMIASLDRPEVMFPPSWEFNALPGFMVQLYALYKQEPIDFSKYDTGNLDVYQGIIDCWDTPAALADALRKACNYHTERSHGEDPGLEFVYSPYTAFPAEILAIYRVRADLGLETPMVEHPFLGTPLVHPPEQMPPYEDELLDRVVRQLRAEIPDI